MHQRFQSNPCSHDTRFGYPSPVTDQPTPTPPIASQRTVAMLVFFIVFLDMLGIGLIAPMTPYIVERFASDATAVAMMTVSYSAAQFLATPVLGALSDRYGRRPILILSLLGSAAGYVMYATGTALWVLYLSRVIDGFTGGNISTAQAAITDITPPKDRVKVFGMIGAAFGLGFVLGPTLSTIIVKLFHNEDGSPLWPNAPIWAASFLSLTASLLVFLKLPETHPHSAFTKGKLTLAELNPFAVLLHVLSRRGAGVIIAVIFVIGFAHAELRAVFGKLMLDKLSFNEKDSGMIFAAMGIIAVIVQGLLVRRIAAKLGERTTVLVGLPLAVIGYALIPQAWNWPSVLGIIAISGFGMGLVGPPTNGLLSKAVPPSMVGSAFGASQSAASLGLVLGPIWAGPAYDKLGREWPFWSAAMLLGVGFLIVLAFVTGPAANVNTEATESPAAH